MKGTRDGGGLNGGETRLSIVESCV